MERVVENVSLFFSVFVLFHRDKGHDQPGKYCTTVVGYRWGDVQAARNIVTVLLEMSPLTPVALPSLC